MLTHVPPTPQTRTYATIASTLQHEAMASSAVRAADKMQARLIIVFTVTGNTARMLAKYKPTQPILTLVCPARSASQLIPSKRALGGAPASSCAADEGPSAASLARVHSLTFFDTGKGLGRARSVCG